MRLPRGWPYRLPARSVDLFRNAAVSAATIERRFALAISKAILKHSHFLPIEFSRVRFERVRLPNPAATLFPWIMSGEYGAYGRSFQAIGSIFFSSLTCLMFAILPGSQGVLPRCLSARVAAPRFSPMAA